MSMHEEPARMLASPLTVGAVTIPNRVSLAPMSGVSDRPFRALALRFGAGLVVSEMTAGEKLAMGNAEAADWQSLGGTDDGEDPDKA